MIPLILVADVLLQQLLRFNAGWERHERRDSAVSARVERPARDPGDGSEPQNARATAAKLSGQLSVSP
jgi:hypothetical protein